MLQLKFIFAIVVILAMVSFVALAPETSSEEAYRKQMEAIRAIKPNWPPS